MGEICGLKFHLIYVQCTYITNFFIQIPQCAKGVIFITEFALLSTNLPFYEVKMTPFAHGGISIKNFVMHVHILNETLSHKFHPYSILST